MGNRCGDLALWSGIACGAEIVVTSDTGFDEQDVLDRLRDIDIIKKKKRRDYTVSQCRIYFCVLFHPQKHFG